MRNRRSVMGMIGLVCLAGGALGAYRFQQKRNTVPTLSIEARTRAVFENADKVEVFRLADFHEMMRPNAENEAIEKQKYGEMRTYTITRVGTEQNAAFAQKLLSALEQAAPKDNSGISCFDPGVGFRVHQGKSFVEIFVCFHCSGVEIVTTDENKQEIWRSHTELGAARTPLLALSRRAFPDDKNLRELKE